MILEDKIYGKEEINENILIDLINSNEIQRLKNVSQLGMPEEYFSKKGFSRYEHSLGVLILLRKLGANLNEQVAGLLHDVNHTVFSHVVDWIFGDPTKEDYQDNNFLKFIKNSFIPKILKKYNFDIINLENLKNYSLLEQDAPSLCADRVDYSLRELAIDGFLKESVMIFRNLMNINGRIVIKNLEIGKLFYEKYSFLNKTSWSGEDSRMRYVILSNILKKAFEKDILCFEDLNKSEKDILDILYESNEDYILENLNLLKTGFNLIEDEKGIELKTKFRYIDPEIVFDENYEKLSNLSEEYRKIIEQEKEKAESFKRVQIKMIKENQN